MKKLTIFLCAVVFAVAAEPKPTTIPDKDRAEAFRLQRDMATIQAQFQGMKAQYEATVKQMQEKSVAAEKELGALQSGLKKTCEAGARVYDESTVTCVEKPPAPPAKK